MHEVASEAKDFAPCPMQVSTHHRSLAEISLSDEKWSPCFLKLPRPSHLIGQMQTQLFIIIPKPLLFVCGSIYSLI